ncbi:D-beta-hydroxybutyrate dehydrogenase [Aplysia californica]|uniref:3-oxoacyl-[acyl-carrier-protein] reductase n=1 Tax=Aplysia californica TaxID=6500 RepID=A0ABM0JHC9_APLCA|nr:D-beta-hydroxybutyrate dehydrogenase [Aplysia californica]XP_005093690.1 D-beta-hydroxybutyrate dehydrogenase [Aplysia californica]
MAQPKQQDFLSGRVALVTGSTSGIGEGIARSLASRGANVIITGFGDEQAITKLLESFKSDYNVEAVFIGGDLCKPEDVTALHKEAVKAFPSGIDILVNNAGIQHVSPIEEFPLDVWNKMMALMVTAPFQLTQLCMDSMKKKGWGRIINTSSVRGHIASPNKTGYTAAKHGLLGLTKAVAVEVAGSGVTCNALCPGCVETPLFVKQAEDRAKDQGITYEEGRAQMLAVQPSKQPVLVNDLGEAVVFMCSSAGNQMTGQSLIIDGGWVAT